MSRVRAPLLSWSASGAIADTQVYSTWKGRPYVRQFVIPANPDSPAQQLTRNTFGFLQRLFGYIPGGAIGAWDLLGENNRYTARNAWLAANVSPLRSETDLTLITLSPSAGGGIVAENVQVTPGSENLTVDLTAPTLPNGWSVVAGYAMAVQSVDPQTSDIYDVASGSSAGPTYSIQLDDLTPSVDYVVGGWFEFEKADGRPAYGAALQSVAQPNA